MSTQNVIIQHGGISDSLELDKKNQISGPGTCEKPHIANIDSQCNLLELLSHCLESGEESAWNEFVAKIQPMIASTISRTIRRWTMPDPSLVDDLVQETYLKLFANHGEPLRKFSCDHEGGLFGFIKVVASNVVQDHFRSSRCQKRGSGKPEEEIETVGALPFNDSPSRRLEQRILIGEIEKRLRLQAANSQCERNRRIFWLYYRDGMTANAISRLPRINLTAKGVESTLVRLIRSLRLELKAV